jgi:hypothetical protein
MSQIHPNTPHRSAGLFNASNHWLIPLVLDWLDICDIGYLDIAVSADTFRFIWLDCLSAIDPEVISKYGHSLIIAMDEEKRCAT